MSIEERALEKYPKDTIEDKLMRLVYISIASEQRAIDEEEIKAMKKQCDKYRHEKMLYFERAKHSFCKSCPEQCRWNPKCEKLLAFLDGLKDTEE